MVCCEFDAVNHLSIKRHIRTFLVSVPLPARLHETRATLAFAWRVIVGHEDAWPGMHEPFNGQQLRLRAVRELITEFDPDAFIETGTFLGSTTRFFAGNGVPVYTTELKRTFWLMARLKLGWSDGVTLYRGDSRAMLKLIASQHAFARPLLYLDAHWWGDFPLNDELQLVFDSWNDLVIIVDDFRVDDDEGYSFDTYDGRALALDQVALPAQVVAALPGHASDLETGARRGTLYLARGPASARAFGHAVERGLLRLV
jgi:hypothetical protein